MLCRRFFGNERFCSCSRVMMISFVTEHFHVSYSGFFENSLLRRLHFQIGRFVQAETCACADPIHQFAASSREYKDHPRPRRAGPMSCFHPAISPSQRPENNVVSGPEAMKRDVGCGPIRGGCCIFLYFPSQPREHVRFVRASPSAL